MQASGRTLPTETIHIYSLGFEKKPKKNPPPPLPPKKNPKTKQKTPPPPPPKIKLFRCFLLPCSRHCQMIYTMDFNLNDTC